MCYYLFRLLFFFYFDKTGMREMVSAKDIVSSIISAANRKIQRRRKGQDEAENEEHDEEKVHVIYVYVICRILF